jgi:hypothetical protein
MTRSHHGGFDRVAARYDQIAASEASRRVSMKALPRSMTVGPARFPASWSTTATVSVAMRPARVRSLPPLRVSGRSLRIRAVIGGTAEMTTGPRCQVVVGDRSARPIQPPWLMTGRHVR